MFGWLDGMYVTEMRCAGWGEVRDITLFQPKMRDHRSHRLRALPFFINFIQTNTQGDARDTRTPVPTPKPRGQGGGS